MEGTVAGVTGAALERGGFVVVVTGFVVVVADEGGTVAAALPTHNVPVAELADHMDGGLVLPPLISPPRKSTVIE